jgi:hypothetical protein
MASRKRRTFGFEKDTNDNRSESDRDRNAGNVIPSRCNRAMALASRRMIGDVFDVRSVVARSVRNHCLSPECQFQKSM